MTFSIARPEYQDKYVFDTMVTVLINELEVSIIDFDRYSPEFTKECFYISI